MCFFCDICPSPIAWMLQLKNCKSCTSRVKQQEKTRVIKKHVPHIEQQVMRKMIPYLSMQRMLQSLRRKGQQQWRYDQPLISTWWQQPPILCGHRVDQLHVCPSSVGCSWIEASWHVPLFQWVQFYTKHMGDRSWFKTNDLTCKCTIQTNKLMMSVWQATKYVCQK